MYNINVNESQDEDQRITANIETSKVEKAYTFYHGVLEAQNPVSLQGHLPSFP
jgi:hypothetical protein